MYHGAQPVVFLNKTKPPIVLNQKYKSIYLNRTNKIMIELNWLTKKMVKHMISKWTKLIPKENGETYDYHENHLHLRQTK